MQHKQTLRTRDDDALISLDRVTRDPLAPTWSFNWPRQRAGQPRTLSLALQGGSSYGAFTWGVLDRLLEEEGIAFDTISGTSAGAVNAVALADGLASGGPAAARERLEQVWRRISKHAPWGPFGSLGRTPIGSAASASFEMSARMFSPYQLNPFGFNPLREALVHEIDFERLRAAAPVRLLVAATRVSDGDVRLFREHEISADAVLASACLPFLNHAVEIEGEWYWDGGFSANPPLKQVVLESEVDDVLLVETLPHGHDGVPRNVTDIARRVGQIAFGSPLRREMEALADLTRMSQELGLYQSRISRKLDRLRLHHISADEAVKGLDPGTMLNVDWRFLSQLKEFGRTAAQEWLNAVNAEA
jgi:NTE family protein